MPTTFEIGVFRRHIRCAWCRDEWRFTNARAELIGDGISAGLLGENIVFGFAALRAFLEEGADRTVMVACQPLPTALLTCDRIHDHIGDNEETVLMSGPEHCGIGTAFHPIPLTGIDRQPVPLEPKVIARVPHSPYPDSRIQSPRNAELLLPGLESPFVARGEGGPKTAHRCRDWERFLPSTRSYSRYEPIEAPQRNAESPRNARHPQSQNPYQ